MLFVGAMKLFGARPARVGVFVFTAGIMLGTAPFLQAGKSPLLLAMFVFVPAVFGLLFASLWLLSSDLYEKTDNKSAAIAFSKIGAGSLCGGIVGGLVAKGLAPLIDPKWLLFFGAFVVLGVLPLIAQMHRRLPIRTVSKKPDESKRKTRFLNPFSNKYALLLLLISAAGALAGQFIDFQFYAAAASARMDATGNIHFFANFYILLNFSSLMVQLFITPHIQSKFGLGGGLMVLPLALIGGATFVTSAATAFSRSMLRVTEGGLRSSVHRSLWEQAFISVNSEDRSTVKIMVDGVAARMAEMVGAVILFLWLKHVVTEGVLPAELDTLWLGWAVLIIVGFWLVVTQRMKAQIKKDQEGKEAPDLTELDCERFPDQCCCITELGKGLS